MTEGKGLIRVQSFDSTGGPNALSFMSYACTHCSTPFHPAFYPLTVRHTRRCAEARAREWFSRTLFQPPSLSALSPATLALSVDASSAATAIGCTATGEARLVADCAIFAAYLREEREYVNVCGVSVLTLLTPAWVVKRRYTLVITDTHLCRWAWPSMRGGRRIKIPPLLSTRLLII
jgi:hypothetical protein